MSEPLPSPLRRSNQSKKDALEPRNGFQKLLKSSQYALEKRSLTAKSVLLKPPCLPPNRRPTLDLYTPTTHPQTTTLR